MPTNTYVALDTKSLSGVSSITFTSIPQSYTDLVIVINGVNTTGSYPANFRVGNGSVDTGSNYSRTGLSGNGSSATSYRGSNETYFYTDYASDISGGGMSITNVMNYSNTTTNKTFINRCGGAGAAVRAIAGLWRSTAAINTIEVSFGITQTGGTATIYGITAALNSSSTATPPVSGYSLWLDGADDATFTYSSGTVVSQWSDKSGNARHFTQPTTANQPSRISTIRQNNYPSLLFQNSWMYNTGFNWSNSPNTVFMVVKYDTTTVNYSSLFASGASSAGYATAISSDDYYAIFSTSVAPYTYNLLPTSYNADVAVWKTAGVSSGAVTTSFWRNGTAASSTRSITGLNVGTGAVLGASTTGGGDVSPPGTPSEYIFEVLVYPSQLSDTDRTSVEAYLKSKWGIA